MKDNDTYKSILVIVTVFTLIAALTKNYLFIYISLATGIITLLIPAAGHLLVTYWFKLSEILGIINSRVMLFLIYFLLLCPLAFLARLTGRKKLVLKNDNKTGTFFVSRNHQYIRDDMENLW